MSTDYAQKPQRTLEENMGRMIGLVQAPPVSDTTCMCYILQPSSMVGEVVYMQGVFLFLFRFVSSRSPTSTH